MGGGQARHCVFLLVLVMFDILRKIIKRPSKNLQKPGKLYCVTVFYAVIWVSKGPLVTLMLYCRANVIGTCVTQPKIARIIYIASGVLW
jgi:hypothetical protein